MRQGERQKRQLDSNWKFTNIYSTVETKYSDKEIRKNHNRTAEKAAWFDLVRFPAPLVK